MTNKSNDEFENRFKALKVRIKNKFMEITVITPKHIFF